MGHDRLELEVGDRLELVVDDMQEEVEEDDKQVQGHGILQVNYNQVWHWERSEEDYGI